VEYLNGIYAFAVWSEADQSLFMARDRFGVKPLFYAQRGSALILASELKALLAHPCIKPEVDAEGLAEIFALGPARTPGHGVFKGICEVKPAHCLLYDVNGIHLWKYWSLESHPHTDSLKDTVSKVHELVHDSIERQFAADVPVCTFLSGGLDSSAITAFAANYFSRRGQTPLHTYSIDYEGNDTFFRPNDFQPNSDASFVRRMSEQFNTQHHYISFDTPQLVDALEHAVYARDLPGMADIDSSLWLFCREIKKDATVALSGECHISWIQSD
jgi:asparagine synthase (glutamine-hydrolysing)